ncbi:hypothetical protein IV203_007129 [Nitzschia inconspicua]|uniref:Uncharacterized protein n=1 Tax=Nitzschia inconspicua TaxID=303405 RepID=A0A9K3KEH6_9STRA|nr:hypothetical protein IV203_007129 [Nitzschia inconspicua]
MSALRLLFDNNRVRVSDLRLNEGESIRHTMEYPTIRWQVDDGIQLVKANGEAQENDHSSTSSELSTQLIPDKTVVFEDVETICDISNGGRSVFRQIWFEIKQEPRRNEAETRRILNSAIYSTDVGTQLLFENRYCRVWDFYLEAGGGDPSQPHHHVLDYVFVYVAKGRLLGYTHDGKPGLFDSINDDCDVSWFDLPDGAEKMVDCAHGGKNGYDDIPMREYLVELK